MATIENLWQFDLRRGATDHPRNGACLMDAANWIVYQQIGDNPPCACPVIRAYAIGLNDLLPDGERQRLKPFILRVIGNRDPENEQARAEYLVRHTTSTILPLALEGQAAALVHRAAALARGEPASTSHEDPGTAALSAGRGAEAAAVSAQAALNSSAWDAAASDAARIVTAVADAVPTQAAKHKVYETAIAMLDDVLKIGKQARAFEDIEICLPIISFCRAAKPDRIAA